MIFVIGGLSCGKRDYVMREYGCSEKDISADISAPAPVLCDLQELIRNDADGDRLFPLLLEKKIVICSDISCGIVPIDRAEREKREAVGRLCIRLAAAASRVVRVQCGIAQVIKG